MSSASERNKGTGVDCMKMEAVEEGVDMLERSSNGEVGRGIFLRMAL